MQAIRDQLGDRYQVLETLRVTPIYREVRARDLRERQNVLLWLITPVLAPDPASQRALMLAARGVLDSPAPGALPLLGGGVINGVVYLRVPPQRGTCLRVWLLGRRPSMGDFNHIITELCAVVSAAHERGRIHGLLTARDVLLCGERVRLAGTALWSALARRPLLETLSHESAALAPEVKSGKDGDERSDVYGVAAIASELLQAATGSSLRELRKASWNPLLVEAIERALAHGPGARPQTLAGLQTALTVRAATAPPRALAPAAPRALASAPPALPATTLEATGAAPDEATREGNAWRPSPRLPDGRPAAPPAVPRTAVASRPPPIPASAPRRLIAEDLALTPMPHTIPGGPTPRPTPTTNVWDRRRVANGHVKRKRAATHG